MTSGPNRIPTPPPLPQGVNEGEVLALIEGEMLAASRLEAINLALASDARFASMVSKMRRDRSLLRSMPELACPPGVVESVEALLERRMLAGLNDGRTLPRSEPSIVRGRGRRFGDAMGRRVLAVAAMLVLAGGVSYYVSTQRWTPQPQPVGDQKLAFNPEIKPAPASLNQPREGGVARREIDDGQASTRVVATPEGTIPGSATTRERSPSMEAPDGPMALADAGKAVKEDAPSIDGAKLATAARGEDNRIQASPPGANALAANAKQEGDALNVDRAIELASQGKLVVCVRGCDVPSGDPSGRSGWFVGERVNTDVADALAPMVTAAMERRDRFGRALGEGDGQQLIMASAMPGGIPAPIVVPAAMAPRASAPVQIAEAALRLDHAAINSLVTTIRDKRGDVRFEEAHEAMPPQPPPLLPANLFQFGVPPNEWRTWKWVPMIVEN